MTLSCVRVRRAYNGHRSLFLFAAAVCVLFTYAYMMSKNPYPDRGHDEMPARALGGKEKLGESAVVGREKEMLQTEAVTQRDGARVVVVMEQGGRAGGAGINGDNEAVHVVHSKAGADQQGREWLESTEDIPLEMNPTPSRHDPYTLPQKLVLNLPEHILNDPVLKNQVSCIKQYGFDLARRCV